MFLAGEGLKICLRETVHKEDKDKTKKKRRILTFVNWKMPKLALILKSVRKFVVFFFSRIKRICQVKCRKKISKILGDGSCAIFLLLSKV